MVWAGQQAADQIVYKCELFLICLRNNVFILFVIKCVIIPVDFCFPPLNFDYNFSQTLYHVFVIDCDAQTTWSNWQPAVTSKHTGEIDQLTGDLVLQGKSYPATNGFCWTDLQTLIEECMIVGNMVSLKRKEGRVNRE